MPKKLDKYELKRQIAIDFDFTDIDGTAEEIYKRLKEAEKKVLDAGIFSRVEFDTEYGYYDGREIIAYGSRIETDAEYERRLKDNKASHERKVRTKKLAEKVELALYQKLKKKFE